MSPEQSFLSDYKRDGFALAKGLLAPDEVTDSLCALDHLLCARGGFARSDRGRVGAEIHGKILELARRDRPALGRVYDAARKVLPFWGLLGSSAMRRAVATLLETPFPGVAFRGAGIRLDLPHEDKWRSDWHQEYHSQISSPRGLVAWFALSRVDRDCGPVDLAKGSHREGILPVRCLDPMNQRRDYTSTFVIPEVEAIASRYPIVSFDTEPGDVVFIDFLLLHRSGWNRHPAHSRITCQVRYFDMAEPTGIRNNWMGGWQDGGDFTKFHPEKVIA